MSTPYDDTENSDSRYLALQQACKSGDISTVRSILQLEDLVCSRPPQPESLAQNLLQKCLLEAFINSHFAVGQCLIREAGAEIKPIELVLADKASTTIRTVEAFEFLLQEGWNINSTLFDSRTALSFVLGSLPLTKWLLEHGANPNLGPHPIIKVFPNIVPNSGLLLELAACEDPVIAIDLIDLLIQHGAILENSLPLHVLAECGPYQIPNQVQVSNTTSYPPKPGSIKSDPMPALTSSRMPVFQHLLNLGYDPNASDMAHFGPMAHGPPLHWAVRWRRSENARFLLENGADPWGKDRHGRTPLEVLEVEHKQMGEREIERVIEEFM